MMYPSLDPPNEDQIEQSLVRVDNITNQAVAAEQVSNIDEAVRLYNEASYLLLGTMNVLQDGSPPYNALYQHNQNILERITYIQQCSKDKLIEEHKEYEQQKNTQEDYVVLQSPQHRSEPQMNRGDSSTKVTGVAAIMGATAGAILLGPMGLVVGGALTAYASTRDDQVGNAARTAGKTGISAAERVVEMDRQHNLLSKAKDAADATYAAAKRADEQYSISAKFSRAASWSYERIIETENKYHVTDKVGSGISSALTSITQAMGSRGNTGPGSTPPIETPATNRPPW
eukprot:GHVR01111321.1.p1 GENE.GHVR01111321.1~~GHVR01111321.1.p1  ORF type:complete len:287 (+),score=79.65 GHVR01111321.1:26-886(+)